MGRGHLLNKLLISIRERILHIAQTGPVANVAVARGARDDFVVDDAQIVFAVRDQRAVGKEALNQASSIDPLFDLGSHCSNRMRPVTISSTSSSSAAAADTVSNGS